MIKSICIVRLSALGDVLMCVPLIRTLQAHFPQAKITWVISRPAYDLVEGMSGVEFVVIKKPKNARDYWAFWKQFRHKKFDVLLATQASLRANLLYPLITAKRKIGYDKLRAKDAHRWFVTETIAAGQEHTLEGFLQFARALGVDRPEVSWNLSISEQEKAWVDKRLTQKGPVLLVNPAASKSERSWTVEGYCQVIMAAQEQWNAQVILTGGPGASDRELADSILKQVTCLDLVGKTKPKQLLALISKAQAVLCPDTGPSHMAAAMGTPVVALHAVTNPKISGPYNFLHLAVNCYPEAMQSILKQDAETAKWGTRVHSCNAMKIISAKAVLRQLKAILN